MDNEIAFNECIIDERKQGIQEIQQQIGEVNEIFKDLALLVDDQGVMIGNSSDCFVWSSLAILFLIQAANSHFIQMISAPALMVPRLQWHWQNPNLQRYQSS